MQSVSASFPTRVMQRTRDALPGGVLWTSLLVFFLTLAVSKSTVTAEWVGGIEVVPLVALAGAIFMGLLALTPVPWGIGVAIGVAAGPVVAGFAAWPALHAAHPSDALGVDLLQTWWLRVQDGTAVADSAFDLFLISWLMWVTGGWLAWCVLRWRRPLLGLVPGAAAFATNLLNFPNDQNGYVLTVLVLTLALLLWTNYTASTANAQRARDHAAAAVDRRSDAGLRVRRILELGADPPEPEPSFPPGSRKHRRHHRLLDRREAKRRA